MKNEESRLQQQCVNWFRLQYPEPKYLIAAVPNGGNRNAITGVVMKREGVRAGFPDLIIIVDRRILFIEMKSSTGKLNDNQKEVFAMLGAMGYMVPVCNSFDMFVATVNKWMNEN